VKLTTVSKSWKKIFPDNEENECFGFDKEIISATKLAAITTHMDKCENAVTENNKYWLEIDYTISGYGVLTKTR
jgi:hypothetical protein